MLKLRRLAYLIFPILLPGLSVSAELTLSGLAESETAVVSKGTEEHHFRLTADLIIQTGDTLTILPGETLTIADGLFTPPEILVSGSLNAMGEAESEKSIHFDGNGNDWVGIRIQNEGSGNFAYCRFEDATHALFLDGAVSAFQMKHSIIGGTQGHAIRIEGGGTDPLVLESIQITGSGGDGIHAENLTADLFLTHVRIQSSHAHGVFIETVGGDLTFDGTGTDTDCTTNIAKNGSGGVCISGTGAGEAIHVSLQHSFISSKTGAAFEGSDLDSLFLEYVTVMGFADTAGNFTIPGLDLARIGAFEMNGSVVRDLDVAIRLDNSGLPASSAPPAHQLDTNHILNSETGLLLQDVPHLTVQNTLFSRNRIGVALGGNATGTILSANAFKRNPVAICNQTSAYIQAGYNYWESTSGKPLLSYPEISAVTIDRQEDAIWGAINVLPPLTEDPTSSSSGDDPQLDPSVGSGGGGGCFLNVLF